MSVDRGCWRWFFVCVLFNNRFPFRLGIVLGELCSIVDLSWPKLRMHKIPNTMCFFIHNHDKNLKIKTEIQILKRTASREKCFWRSITFFIAFSKIPTKRRFVRLLFSKLNQSRNTKKKKMLGFFSSKDLYLQEQFKLIFFSGIHMIID